VKKKIDSEGFKKLKARFNEYDTEQKRVPKTLVEVPEKQ